MKDADGKPHRGGKTDLVRLYEQPERASADSAGSLEANGEARQHVGCVSRVVGVLDELRENGAAARVQVAARPRIDHQTLV